MTRRMNKTIRKKKNERAMMQWEKGTRVNTKGNKITILPAPIFRELGQI